jgi:hypothetical protein
MSETHLFDPGEISIPPSQRIPEILGRQVGTFMNTTRWVVVELVTDDAPVYGPYGTPNDMFVSPGYAKGTDFEDDFTSWNPMSADRIEQHGYLVGFPRIDIPAENRSMNSLHIWFNNTDVIHSLAIPLASVNNLYVYSQTRTNLQMELDNLTEGEKSRYEVFLARDKETGKMITRDAKYDDVDAIIKEMNERPIAVLPQTSRSVIKAQPIRDPEERKLLDTK